MANLLMVAGPLTNRIAFGGDVIVSETMPRFVEFDAILSVGTQANPSLPWTVVNSNGWLALVDHAVQLGWTAERVEVIDEDSRT